MIAGAPHGSGRFFLLKRSAHSVTCNTCDCECTSRIRLVASVVSKHRDTTIDRHRHRFHWLLVWDLGVCFTRDYLHMTHDWLGLANGVIPLVYWPNEVLAHPLTLCGEGSFANTRGELEEY